MNKEIKNNIMNKEINNNTINNNTINNIINNLLGKINYFIEKSNNKVYSVNKNIKEQIEPYEEEEEKTNYETKQENIKDNYENNSINKPKVWYTHYRSYIVKSVLDTGTGEIYEKMIPYNQPSNFRNFLDNYFENELN